MHESMLYHVLRVSGVLILAGAFVFGVMQGYRITAETVAMHTADALDRIDDRIESLVLAMNNIPRGTGNDLLFLSELSSLAHFIETQTPAYQATLEEDLLAFIKENTIYYTIEYHDATGENIAGVAFDGTQYTTGISNYTVDEPHIARTQLLDKGELYISPIEHIQSSEIPEIHRAVLYYGTPIIHDGQQRGVLLARVYVNYFLDDIRRASRDHELVFLVNRDGRYLAHPDATREYNTLTQEGGSLYDDYPEVAEQILELGTERHIKGKDHIFTLRYIHPTVRSFEIYQGAAKVFGDAPEEHYFWVLVSVSNAGHLLHTTDQLWSEYLMIILVTGALFITALALFVASRISLRTIATKRTPKTPHVRMLFFVGIGATSIAIIYVLVVTSFFSGWQNMKWFDTVPDLGIFVVASMLASFALYLSGRARVGLFSGAVLLGTVNLIEVVFQEYQVLVGPLTFAYWGPLVTVKYLAFLLLLFGVAHLRKQRFRL